MRNTVTSMKIIIILFDKAKCKTKTNVGPLMCRSTVIDVSQHCRRWVGDSNILKLPIYSIIDKNSSGTNEPLPTEGS